MSDLGSESTRAEKMTQRWVGAVAITAIVCTTIIALGCIAACMGVLIVFFDNAPW